MLSDKRTKSTSTVININIDNLNVRRGPGYDYDVVKTATPKEYTLKDIQSSWGKIANNEWVCLDFVEVIKPQQKVEEKEDEPTD